MYSEAAEPSSFKAAEKHFRSAQWEEGLLTFPSPGRYLFPERPGLVLLKGHLSESQQVELVSAALLEYLQPPYRTNLGGDPVPDLYTAQPDLMKKVTWSTMGRL